MLTVRPWCLVAFDKPISEWMAMKNSKKIIQCEWREIANRPYRTTLLVNSWTNLLPLTKRNCSRTQKRRRVRKRGGNGRRRQEINLNFLGKLSCHWCYFIENSIQNIHKQCQQQQQQQQNAVNDFQRMQFYSSVLRWRGNCIHRHRNTSTTWMPVRLFEKYFHSRSAEVCSVNGDTEIVNLTQTYHIKLKIVKLQFMTPESQKVPFNWFISSIFELIECNFCVNCTY